MGKNNILSLMSYDMHVFTAGLLLDKFFHIHAMASNLKLAFFVNSKFSFPTFKTFNN